MTHETWKPVMGYEGRYEVSDLGRIRRLLAYRSNGARIPPGIVKACRRSKKEPGKAYLCIALNNGNGQRTFSVHRLVLEAFRGPCPEGMEGCHNDGDRENNLLDNLRWDTQSGNQRDRDKHGTRNTVCGERHPHSTLPDADIERAFRLRAEGWSQYRIAEAIGSSQGHVSAVLRGAHRSSFQPSDQIIVEAIMQQLDVNDTVARDWIAIYQGAKAA